MTPKRSLRFASIGAAATALCAFTPILVPPLTGLGLGAFVPWVPWLLLPLLAFFVGWLLISVRQNMAGRGPGSEDNR
ncbi:MAG: mercury resistance system transport protein MerF [Verrucomicrobia bacterium]|nr:mercury resistance system transport protein MerF [Verrucomicrobiota bacterium]